MSTSRWLLAIACAVAALFVASPQARAEDSILGGASDAGQAQADANSEFLKNYHPPILTQSPYIESGVQRFTDKVAKSFWEFYRSALWQSTIRGLVGLCGLLGIFHAFSQIASGEASASKTYLNIMIKVGICAVAIGQFAPAFPIFMSRVINATVTKFSYAASAVTVVESHQDAFLAKATLMTVRAATILEPRLQHQFYITNRLPSSFPWEAMPGREIPRDTFQYAQTPGEGTSAHPRVQATKVTPLTFIAIGPPELTKEYRIADSMPSYLLAPPMGANPYGPDIGEFWSTQSLKSPVRALMLVLPGSNATTNHAMVSNPDPSNSSKIKVQVRPFSAGVATVVSWYEQMRAKVAGKTPTLEQIRQLRAIDKAAVEVLDQSTDRLIYDIVCNITMANQAEKPWEMDNPTSESAQKDAAKSQQVLADFAKSVGASVARDFENLLPNGASTATYQWVLPVGLFFANAYIILCIWLLPSLIAMWAAFFLLPPFFDLSNALKKGAAVIVALPLFPILLQLIIGLCFAIVAGSQEVDKELDPNGAAATSLIYAYLPSTSPTGAEGVAMDSAGRGYLAFRAASALRDANGGVMTLIAWLVVLGLLVASPVIVAKFIMGMGAADAISSSIQSSVTSGGIMATKGVAMGGAKGLQDAAAFVSAAKNGRF